jgi:hypothetical protein
MGCRARFLLAGLTAFGVLGFATPTPADSLAPPTSYKRVTPGEKFVFVMVSWIPVEDEVGRWNEETAAGIREVRRTYTRSGMYRNDGSTDPLWTVDWYAYGVDLTPDGVHLIRPGPWARLLDDRTPDLDCEAVSFFANGRLIRTYHIRELVDDPGRFKRSVSHFSWREEGRVSGEFEYTITTRDGNRFVFDIRTGAVVSEARMGRVTWWGKRLALLVVGVLAAWLIYRRRSRKQRPGRSRPASAPRA